MPSLAPAPCGYRGGQSWHLMPRPPPTTSCWSACPKVSRRHLKWFKYVQIMHRKNCPFKCRQFAYGHLMACTKQAAAPPKESHTAHHTMDPRATEMFSRKAQEEYNYIRNAKQVGISEPFFPRVSRSFTKLFFCNQVNLCTHPGLQLVERCTARADRSQAMKCLGFAFKGPISWDFWASHKKKTSNNIKRIKAKGNKQGLMNYVYIYIYAHDTYIHVYIYIFNIIYI